MEQKLVSSGNNNLDTLEQKIIAEQTTITCGMEVYLPKIMEQN
jgi:hypothetical protein